VGDNNPTLFYGVLMAKAKEPVESIAPVEVPQITFTEAEVQGVADFINYCYKNASFTMKMDDAVKMNKMLSAMHQHVSKMEKYIFEFKKNSSIKKD
jgi:hypothetical protein